VFAAQYPAERRGDDRVEPPSDALRHRPDRLIEPQWVGDAVDRETIDDQPPLIAQNDLLPGQFDGEETLVEADHGLDQRDFDIQAGVIDGADDLPELDDQDALGLLHGKQAGLQQPEHQQKSPDDGQCDPVHRAGAPCWGWAGFVAITGSADGVFSGRNGTRPFNLSSTTSVRPCDSTDCIASRYIRRSVMSFAWR